MFIVEIENRNTHVSKGFLIEEEYRGKIGFGLTSNPLHAYQFKCDHQAMKAGMELVEGSPSLRLIVREV